MFKTVFMSRNPQIICPITTASKNVYILWFIFRVFYGLVLGFFLGGGGDLHTNASIN